MSLDYFLQTIKKMMIYVFTTIFFLLNLGVYNPLIAETTAVKANYSIMPKGAPCPECGGMNVHIEAGYTTEWQDYEGIACIHGYQNGYDMGQLRWIYGAYKLCGDCGWKSNQEVRREGRLVCHGY